MPLRPALWADYQQRLQDLLPLRQLLKGSVYELKTRCGKPSCHCASPGGPLHSSTVLSWSGRGKTRLRTLPEAAEANLFRSLIRGKRFNAWLKLITIESSRFACIVHEVEV